MSNQYADRDPMQLDEDGGYYCRHTQAMTREGLHSKVDIAKELAWRDREIDRYKKALDLFAKFADEHMECLGSYLEIVVKPCTDEPCSGCWVKHFLREAKDAL